MGVEEATKEFIKIWDIVFADLSLDRTARSVKLEGTIKNLLNGCGISDNQKMTDGDQGHGCKGYVIPFIVYVSLMCC
jgi:hypothetical protein